MKKGISIVLALTLSAAGVYTVKADELTDAQKQLNNIQNSIDDKKEELADINKEKKSVEKSINDLEEKMKSSSSTLTELNGKISDLNFQTKDLEKKIAQNEANLKEQDEMFKKRVRAIYINGNQGYLDLILNSKSFSDFVSRVDSLGKIMEYDKKLMESIENNKKSLELQKSDIDKKKKETTALKQQADGKLKELQGVSEEKKSLMADLEKDKVAYEKAIKEEEDQSAAIATMVKQIKKKKEEEKKKAEEEKKQQQGQNGGSSNTVVTSPDSPLGKLYCVTGKPTYVTSPYGWRVHPVLGTKRFHAGMDLGVWTGTPIYSLTDGEVIYAGWMSGYGNVIMVDHGSITSVYAHNSSLVGRVGQKVKGGQLISYSGNTGLSSGPHLHFEIRKENGETTNPAPYYVR
ncbi:peptidoglycan DD-metalloendopeptidase family protein [Clostridium swellfunianum]|uniref:murein hydrolase activator EnvC family protein n=1 Tax=Clostridium swellfunianum TaxID=1367462 RepID=UPI00202ED298|nr:peptidoglycan DD-metalloendopeptidase family protein [Clostridium swellfunianum]MCM0651062.1 peptidoglycan DD-metalloendopeptidase family protein [Clostridium swellfunianum]